MWSIKWNLFYTAPFIVVIKKGWGRCIFQWESSGGLKSKILLFFSGLQCRTPLLCWPCSMILEGASIVLWTDFLQKGLWKVTIKTACLLSGSIVQGCTCQLFWKAKGRKVQWHCRKLVPATQICLSCLQASTLTWLQVEGEVGLHLWVLSYIPTDRHYPEQLWSEELPGLLPTGQCKCLFLLS